MTFCAAPDRRRRTSGASSLPLLLLLAAACASDGAVPHDATSAERLTNPGLSPEYSQWLVGPVGEMATPEEIARFLSLSDDAAAAAFIEGFWSRRNPYPERPDNVVQETFQERAADADRLYSEAGYLGRRTARGTVFVLYGPPGKIDYQVAEHSADPPITVWEYTMNAEPGLDGKSPQRFYRFVKRRDVTEFYTPRKGPDLGRDRTRSSSPY